MTKERDKAVAAKAATPAEGVTEPAQPLLEEEPAGDAVDPRDAEIEALRAELAARDAAERPMDEKDRVLAELRAQLAEKTSTPEGREDELLKAVAALSKQVEAMQKGLGKVPVKHDPDSPPPFLYGASLATGEIVYTQYPISTHHHSPDHDMEVPVMAYFTLDDAGVERAGEWYAEYAAAAKERELAAA